MWTISNGVTSGIFGHIGLRQPTCPDLIDCAALLALQLRNSI